MAKETFNDIIQELVGQKVKVQTPHGIKTGILRVWDPKHQSLIMHERKHPLPTVIRGSGWTTVSPTED